MSYPDSLETSTTKVFRDDLARINEIAPKLAVLYRARFNNEHVISYALDSLEKQLKAEQSEALAES